MKIELLYCASKPDSWIVLIVGRADRIGCRSSVDLEPSRTSCSSSCRKTQIKFVLR